MTHIISLSLSDEDKTLIKDMKLSPSKFLREQLRMYVKDGYGTDWQKVAEKFKRMTETLSQDNYKLRDELAEYIKIYGKRNGNGTKTDG
jgi:hypothetical protein